MLLKEIRMYRRVRLAALQASPVTRLIHDGREIGKAGDLTTRKAVRQLPSAVLSQLDRIARAQIGLERFDNRDLKEVSSDGLIQALEALKDSDRQVRLRAVRALVELGDKAAVLGLIQALKDFDQYVRFKAVEALGELGDKATVPDLIQALKDPDGAVRRATAEALGRMGDKTAVPDLIQALKDPKEKMQEAAVEALGKIGKAAVPGLMQALKDPDGKVCQLAVEALRKIGDKSAVPALETALKNWHTSSKKYLPAGAAKALLAILDKNPELEGYYESKYGTNHRDVLKAYILIGEYHLRWGEVVKLGASAIPALSASLLSTSLYDDDAVNAIKTLGERGDTSAVSALENVFEIARGARSSLRLVSKESRRLASFETYNFIISVSAAEALLRILDRHPELEMDYKKKFGGNYRNELTAYSLVWNKKMEKVIELGASAIPALITALYAPRVMEQKVAGYVEFALDALSRIGPDAKSAVPELKTFMSGIVGYDNMAHAQEAIGKIGGESEIPTLIDTIKNARSSKVRAGAAKALGRIGDKSAVPALIRSLEYRGIDIRAAAAEALLAILDKNPELEKHYGKKFGKDYRDILTAYLLIGNEEWEKVANLGSAAVPALIEVLKDEYSKKDEHYSYYAEHKFDPYLANAAEALASIGDKRAIPALKAVLKWWIKDEYRIHIEEALAKLRGKPTKRLIEMRKAAIEPREKEHEYEVDDGTAREIIEAYRRRGKGSSGLFVDYTRKGAYLKIDPVEGRVWVISEETYDRAMETKCEDGEILL